MRRVALGVFFVVIGLGGTMGAEDPGAYKVIVNPANATTQLSRLKVGEIFLKKEKRWPDGQTAVPVEPPIKSATRQRFDQEIFGKPVIALSAYWQQMIFGGKGIPPSEKSSDAEVVTFVRETPGAVGYVSSGTDISGVKVLAVVD